MRLSGHSNVYLNKRRGHTHTSIHHSQLRSFASLKQRFACAVRTLRLLAHNLDCQSILRQPDNPFATEPLLALRHLRRLR